jgi:predicted DNA-binding protein with PD1-like motif
MSLCTFVVLLFQRIRDLEGPFEIVSLVGTLSGGTDHLHISLSDKDGNVIGGHVIGGLYVYTTAEIVIGECQQLAFDREHDASTGFAELVVRRRP